jgi:lysophospholipase L1-like esterase
MASKSTPDIVVIMLGTNDVTKDDFNAQRFRDDYTEIVKIFQNLKSKP